VTDLNPLPTWATTAVLDDVERLIRLRSEADPISSKEIADLLSLPDPPGQPGTRAVITEILRRGLAPIGATARGYFLITTEEQLDRYTRVLRDRESAIYARTMAVRRAFFDGPRDLEAEPMWKWVPIDAEERE